MEVLDLEKGGLLTKEEAREILFSLETDEDRDKQSLQEEIKFLRALVQSLSSRSQIVEHIRYVEKPYVTTPWYPSYQFYCGATTGLTNTGALGAQAGLTNNALNTQALTGSSLTFANSASTGGSTAIYNFSSGVTDEPDFDSIKTF